MEKLGDDKTANENALVAKKKTGSSTRNYVLRSCLHPKLVHAAHKSIAALKDAELEKIPEDQDLRRSEVHGSLLGWENTESIELAGVLQIVLCLILVNGRSIPDAQLRNQMKNFFVHPKTNFRVPGSSPNKAPTFEEYLGILHNQGYLQRNQVSANGIMPSQPAAGGRRKSGRRGDDDEELAVEWKWGARAHAEISEMSVANFMADFMKERWIHEQTSMIEEEELEDGQEEGGSNRRGGGNNRSGGGTIEEIRKKGDGFHKRCLKDIIRDAGGDLTVSTASEAQEG
ncbi:hypothetical protein FRC03_006274 [Tulasnella sp. 419]|nr:hypothetical protein FRC03_006274 [Tulasnella sp. 419]